MVAGRHPGGRPTLFKIEYVDQAYRYCLLGATIVQMAEFFGVSKQTIDLWIKTRPEFRGAIERGRARADAEMAQSLFHRGRGYSHNAVKIFLHEGEIIEAPYVEHYPPDTAAASLWLRNRRPDLWRDKQEHEHTGANGGPIDIRRVERLIIDAATGSEIVDDAADTDGPRLLTAAEASEV